MSLFDYIKTNLPILSVIQEYTTLKPVGLYWKGVCPFHSEKTGSFTVSPHKDIFYCFGCQAGGDVISFIAKIENMSQIDAAKYLIDRYKISVPQELLSQSENFYNSDLKDSYLRVCNFLEFWCNNRLKKEPDALKYVLDRGFNNEVIEKFKIGFFPAKKDLKHLLKAASNEGLMLKDLIDANIFVEKAGEHYPSFEERIMFPIHNTQGECCGFGGRVFKAEDDRAKYYNSKENPFFNKGSILYGLDLAKKYIQKSGEVYMVEGYADCIAMAENGILNTVATLGTACTHEHLKTLARFASKIHIVYDGDDAGQKTMLRLTELAWDVNIEIDVVVLPKDEDPASYLASRKDSKQFLENKIDIFSFFIRSKKRDFLNLPLSEKLVAVKKVTDIINKLGDPVKRGILFQKVSQEFNIPLNALGQKTEFSNSTLEELTDKDSIEYKILGAMLHDKDLISTKFDSIIKFLPENIIKIIESFKDSKNFETLLTSLNTTEKDIAIKVYMSFNMQEFNLELLLSGFQKKNWKAISGALKEKINSAQKNGNQEDLMKYLKQLNEWKLKVLSSTED